MAQQLDTQEYLSRLQASARDPAAYALLAQQGGMPAGYEQLLQGVGGQGLEQLFQGVGGQGPNKPKSTPISHPSVWPDGVKLPADTEIVKSQVQSQTNFVNFYTSEVVMTVDMATFGEPMTSTPPNPNSTVKPPPSINVKALKDAWRSADEQVSEFSARSEATSIKNIQTIEERSHASCRYAPHIKIL